MAQVEQNAEGSSGWKASPSNANLGVFTSIKVLIMGILRYILVYFWYILVLTPKRVNPQNSSKKLVGKNSSKKYKNYDW